MKATPEIIQPLPDYGRPSPAFARFITNIMRGMIRPEPAQFSETPAKEPRGEKVFRPPSVARLWKVTFEVVNARGRRETCAVEIECATPVDRKNAERAVRKSVHQTIARFVEFYPIQ